MLVLKKFRRTVAAWRDGLALPAVLVSMKVQSCSVVGDGGAAGRVLGSRTLVIGVRVLIEEAAAVVGDRSALAGRADACSEKPQC